MNNDDQVNNSAEDCGELDASTCANVGIEVKLDKDDEGYLLNPESWTPQAATQLANGEGITLSDDHWEIILFVRDYYEEHQVIPDVRHVTAYLVGQHNIDKKSAKARLFNLFPYGYVRQACKIAGMKKPRAWSTG